jgi:hypothetical protein
MVALQRERNSNQIKQGKLRADGGVTEAVGRKQLRRDALGRDADQ